MQIINTHSHIYAPSFVGDRNKAIERAKSIGTTKILMPDIVSHQRSAMLELSSAYPDLCVQMFGVHPTYIKEDYEQELALLESVVKTHSFCAIGEIGLDYYWDTSYKNEQIDAFMFQLDLAYKLKKPVAIHVRESWDDTLNIIQKHAISEGVFHCFTGSLEQANIIINKGFLLGIGGVVTYKNSHLPEVLSKISLEHIVVETDDPWLPPVPHRGKQNEPSYILYIVEKLAGIYNTSVEEVASITHKNATQLFRLP